jgi:hypothetical protein
MGITTIFNLFYNDLIDFSHSTFFLLFKIVMGVYVVVVLADIIMLIMQRNVYANIRQMRFGMNIPSEFVTGKDKMKERWTGIRKRLESDNESEYKVAIIEADALIDDLLQRMGYKGGNMGERIENIPEGQLAELGEMKAAHEIRNRIIHEEDFKVDKEIAHDVLNKYAHLLHHFEVLD